MKSIRDVERSLLGESSEYGKVPASETCYFCGTSTFERRTFRYRGCLVCNPQGGASFQPPRETEAQAGARMNALIRDYFDKYPDKAPTNYRRPR